MEAFLGGLTVLSIAGAIPRVGFVRALTFGWRSSFKTAYPLSVRKSEIRHLDNSIKKLGKGSYITVIGEKGIGKSCFIDTTLNRCKGVVKVSTQSGASESAIVEQVLREIAGIEAKFNPAGSARRVLFFYSFLFQRPPIVVLRVPERHVGQQFANLTSAVRSLTDEYGLRVIVDGTRNSIPPELLMTSSRNTVFIVEPMTREQIESIPEFQGLIDFLKAHLLDSPVWKVLGGSPACYVKLKETIDILTLSNTSAAADNEMIGQVKNFLQAVLSDTLNRDVLDSTSNTQQIQEIVKVFREHKSTKMSLPELQAMGFVVEFPNNVFRKVKIQDDWFIEPATAAVSLIILENVRDTVDVRKLIEKLFQEASAEKIVH